MALSHEELQQYVGQSLQQAQEELESQGYKTHTVRLGTHATGFIPSNQGSQAGDNASEPQKRAIISYNGDHPQQLVTAIRQD